MRVGSLFSGVGGFDLGLERAGHEIVWQVEFDKQCRSVLRHHWPNADLYEDVNNVGRATLAPCDILCGGFPCQDLSVAGGRKGLAGERSGLWGEFHRIIGELSPTWLLIENVPGLLSSNEGRDMAVIVHGLEELGYGWSYRILDSQYFGVPQRRRRVFIVGHLGNRSARKIFPLAGAVRETSVIIGEDISYALDANYYKGTNTLDKNRRQLVSTGLRIRRLTPTECERLQGFPDGWTEGLSDTQRYKTLGNAVTVNVVEAVMNSFAKVEEIG